MARDPKFAAGLEAERVLKEVGIDSLPVDPFTIARHFDIEVEPKPTDEAGVSGMLVRVGDFYAIGYATHIDNEGFQRFSVSHELGHYFMPGHTEAVFDEKGFHFSTAGFRSADRFEQEADHFAAQLLMPKRLFTSALQKSGSGLQAVERLSEFCKTSLLSTAIRWTQCTSDPVAIVVSTGATIDYCFMSDALKDLKGIEWIKKGSLLPRESVTARFNKDPANVQGGRRTDGSTDVQDWFGGSRKIEVSEEVVGLGQYGRSLTILYDIEIPDPDDEDDDDSLQESWMPQFRR